jgi:hypothetical protein
VGQHQRADPGTPGGGGRFLHRRVVIADVLDPLRRQQGYELLADDGVYQSVCVGGEFIEALARHGVARQHS